MSADAATTRPERLSGAISGNAIRRIVLAQSKRAGVGHIGSALSVADIIAALYGGVLQVQDPADPARDRFVLSKGHAVLAVYAALSLRGWLAPEQLDTYCGDGSLLGVHPEHALPGIDFASGSLGHGLSYAAGAALAARMQGSARRAFALLSDAECNEGSVWEAAMFAPAQRLDRLTVVIDYNKWQATGRSDEVMALAPLRRKWEAFGWDAVEVDGHDLDGLLAALRRRPDGSGRPRALVAHTVKGRGVSFMEDDNNWHYRVPNADEVRRAKVELGLA